MTAASFKAVPTQDDLAALDRDLSFHPVVNPTPEALTPEQVERFNRDGYLMPFRIFDEAEVADLRAYFDRLLAKYSPRGRTATRSARRTCGTAGCRTCSRTRGSWRSCQRPARPETWSRGGRTSSARCRATARR